MEKSVCKY